jgi:hypothetical protein
MIWPPRALPTLTAFRAALAGWLPDVWAERCAPPLEQRWAELDAAPAAGPPRRGRPAGAKARLGVEAHVGAPGAAIAA